MMVISYAAHVTKMSIFIVGNGLGELFLIEL